jgi:SAM-dependent methyltransferase
MDIATIAEPTYLKVCCADLWSHPGIRLLSGDALRPGGLSLTEHALSILALPAGRRVLDVGCGPGSTVAFLSSRALRPVGIDFSPALAKESSAHAPATAGDAERLPFPEASFDGAFMECVLSAVPDKRKALSQIHRVLRPGTHLALSDVVVEGPLPPPLDSFVGWIACAAGAEAADGYRSLLEDAGFSVTHREDHSAALAELVSQARRSLALLQGALRAGVISPDTVVPDQGLIELGHNLLATAARAVETGVLGYALFIGRKP